jgi:gluconate 2-dehydrogenase subunit 3-like protein
MQVNPVNQIENSGFLLGARKECYHRRGLIVFSALLQSENGFDEELVVSKDRALTVIRRGLGLGRSFTRREMVQRLLAGAGVGAAWPMVAASHPIHALLADDALFSEAEARMAAADWKPLFLNAQQNESLAALSESIVPGSGKGQVNRFIDLLLSVDAPTHREKFVASLSAIESESQKRFGHAFAALLEEKKIELLTIASKDPQASKEKEAASGESSAEEHAGEHAPTLHDHFENLKGWISGAYYSSETGMRELGWTGDYAFESYPACDHAEGHD